MIEIAEKFKTFYGLAIIAGACEKKARYFANKETFKATGTNVFHKLGMTKKSKPTRDEVLYCVCESNGVSATDLLFEYPFIRFETQDIINLLDSLISEKLIEFKDGFYRGVS